MKMILLMILTFILGIGLAEYSYGNMRCGIKPIPPIGCQVGYCQCDVNGCRWVFNCG